jgi:hypothetical protein
MRGKQIHVTVETLPCHGSCLSTGDIVVGSWGALKRVVSADHQTVVVSSEDGSMTDHFPVNYFDADGFWSRVTI